MNTPAKNVPATSDNGDSAPCGVSMIFTSCHTKLMKSKTNAIIRKSPSRSPKDENMISKMEDPPPISGCNNVTTPPPIMSAASAIILIKADSKPRSKYCNPRPAAVPAAAPICYRHSFLFFVAFSTRISFARFTISGID